jgi:hypothetical protein
VSMTDLKVSVAASTGIQARHRRIELSSAARWPILPATLTVPREGPRQSASLIDHRFDHRPIERGRPARYLAHIAGRARSFV